MKDAMASLDSIVRNIKQLRAERARLEDDIQKESALLSRLRSRNADLMNKCNKKQNDLSNLSRIVVIWGNGSKTFVKEE